MLYFTRCNFKNMCKRIRVGEDFKFFYWHYFNKNYFKLWGYNVIELSLIFETLLLWILYTCGTNYEKNNLVNLPNTAKLIFFCYHAIKPCSSANNF